MLGEGPRILYRKLRKAGVLIEGTGLHNQARHQFVSRGDVLHHTPKNLVTPSGLAFIRSVLDEQKGGKAHAMAHS